jgi:hypothetical protein
MKKLLLLIFVVCLQLNIFSQVTVNWGPLGTGLNGTAQCMIVYNSKLIVGGSFSTAGGTLANRIAAWDGSNWSTLGSGITGNNTSLAAGVDGCSNSSNGFVYALEIFNGDLYAAGNFTNAGGVIAANIAKWNGITWSSVGGGIRGVNLGVRSLKVYNNELYVGGSFDSAGTIKVKSLAKWNGLTWADVGGGIKKLVYGIQNQIVAAMDTLNNSLYIGGRFDSVGVITANNIAKWNGSSWSSLGAGINLATILSTQISVFNLTSYHNIIYAGNGQAGVSKWDGVNWSAVGGGLSTGGLPPKGYASAKLGGDLYIAGEFLSAGAIYGTCRVARWNDFNWSLVGIPAVANQAGFKSSVKCLAVYNSELYAGGCFTSEIQLSPAFNPENHIARFLNVVGVKESINKSQIHISPNPSTGQFNLDGLVGENTIEVTDITGRILFTEKTSTENYTLKLDVVASIYFYKITDALGRVKQGKLLVQ